jgi:hypothetical protein
MIIFLSHVAYETNGLKTYIESCAELGLCNNNYQSSWCSPIEPHPDKQYYGRGWLHLSWPCNYYNAGQVLGVDLLSDPDQVASSHKLACAIALWLWHLNQIDKPAQEDNFGATTRIINQIECQSINRQKGRIEYYQKVRQCFGLKFQTKNLYC